MIKKNKKIILLLIFALLQSIANNLAHSVTVAKMLAIHAPDWMNGSYFAIMSLGAFIYLPILGKLSDRIGRKKIFLLGTFFYALAQLMFFIDKNPYTIHLWRFIGGFGGVQMSMVILMVSDYSIEKNLKQVMVAHTLMVNIGDGIGKYIGGIIGNTNFSYTFIFQFICQIILFTIIFLVYKDPNLLNNTNENNNKQKTPKQKLNFNKNHSLFIFTIIVLISYYSRITFNNSITIYGQKNLHFTPALIGEYMLIISAIVIFTLLVISPIVVKFLDLHTTMIFSLLIGSIVWILVYIINNWIFDITFILIYLSTSVLFESTINAFVISKTSPNKKGAMLGIVSSARFLGNTLGSFISGFLYIISPKLPFLIPSILLIIAFIIFIQKYKFKEYKFQQTNINKKTF